MEWSRRTFLKISAVSLLGLGIKPAFKAFAAGTQTLYLPNADALTATRWALIIDTKKCREAGDDCKDCIAACDRVHNIPNIPNPRQEIKWIWKEPYENVFATQEPEYVIEEELRSKPLILLCNHCDNPACVRVCPTKATWKRNDGIVMMDYHRCIGCRFCMAACPYGSRSFNWVDPVPYVKNPNIDYPTRTKGVVEKCDFCAERLDQGLRPACVEACKKGALIFGDVENSGSEVREILRTRFAIRRKPELGTLPQVYYLV